MQKLSYLLFVLKRSYICYYIVCMTVPLTMKTAKKNKVNSQKQKLKYQFGKVSFWYYRQDFAFLSLKIKSRRCYGHVKKNIPK